MTRLPRTSGGQVSNALLLGCFVLYHVQGSNHFLRKSGVSSLVAVLVHGNRDLPIGTLRSIVRQSGLTIQELNQSLRG